METPINGKNSNYVDVFEAGEWLELDKVDGPPLVPIGEPRVEVVGEPKVLKGHDGKWELVATFRQLVSRLVAFGCSGASRLVHRHTQRGNAERLVSLYGDDIRYCFDWGKDGMWLTWNGKQWEKDETGARIRSHALNMVRGIYEREAPPYPQGPFVDDEDKEKQEKSYKERCKDVSSFALKSESKHAIEGMIYFAKDMRLLRAVQFDADPYLFNCQNGTIDLRTGELLKHNRDHLQAKISPASYYPDAKCPRWESFLSEIFGGNGEMLEYIQQIFGYFLTGDASQKLFFVMHGDTDTGKTTLLRTFNRHIMGEYGGDIDVNALMLNAGENKKDTTVASLLGKRFIMSSEVNEGAVLNAGLVKKLTGGDDDQVGRHLFRENFTFRPSHKICLDTNEKPGLSAADSAAWGRMKAIPFNVRFYRPDTPEAQAGMPLMDLGLRKKLEAEADGILAWAVQGCLKCNGGHFKTPSIVKESVEEYRHEQDVVEQFIEKYCETGANLKIDFESLYDRYALECSIKRERQITSNAFGRRLEQLKYKRHVGTGGKKYRLGLKLKGAKEE